MTILEIDECHKIAVGKPDVAVREEREVNSVRDLIVIFVAGLASMMIFLPTVASAQPRQGQTPSCCWDMWDPGWTQRPMWDPGRMGQGQRHRMVRHWTFMHNGVPPTYRDQASTVAPTEATIREGAALYGDNCASCHGPTGQGDGEAGRALNPSPALLSHMIRMPMAVDEYLLWTISEGGEPFGTDMPAFKDALTPEEIWKVIAFMRAGFPASAAEQ